MKRTTDYDTIIVKKKRYSKHHMPFSACKHLSDDVYIEEMALQRLEDFEMETTCDIQIKCQRWLRN